MQTLVWSVAMYECESWTINAADRNRPNAFEMDMYRRMLRISWTEHRTNIDAAAGGAADLAAPTGVVVAIEWDCGRPLDGSLVASASACWVAGFVTGLPISFFVAGVVSWRIVTIVSAHLIVYRSV